MDEPTARLVHYSGRVQGVGFRATARSIARLYEVTGYVRNLADGRVQILVEGDDTEVERFLDAIRHQWQGCLDDEKTENREASGQFSGFEITL